MTANGKGPEAKDVDRFWQLYDYVLKEEWFAWEAYEKCINFHFGLTSALFAATVAGVLNASTPVHYAFLCVGPVLTCVVAVSTSQATSRDYRSWLEKIAQRAKIEQQLGLTRSLPGPPMSSPSDTGLYWPREPLVPLRYVKDRGSYRTSDEFIEKRLRKGRQLWVGYLCRVVLAVSIMELAGLFWKVVS